MPLSAFVFLPACLFVSRHIRRRTLTWAKVPLMFLSVSYALGDFVPGTRVNVWPKLKRGCGRKGCGEVAGNGMLGWKGPWLLFELIKQSVEVNHSEGEEGCWWCTESVAAKFEKLSHKRSFICVFFMSDPPVLPHLDRAGSVSKTAELEKNKICKRPLEVIPPANRSVISARRTSGNLHQQTSVTTSLVLPKQCLDPLWSLTWPLIKLWFNKACQDVVIFFF